MERDVCNACESYKLCMIRMQCPSVESYEARLKYEYISAARFVTLVLLGLRRTIGCPGERPKSGGHPQMSIESPHGEVMNLQYLSEDFEVNSQLEEHSLPQYYVLGDSADTILIKT